MADRQLPPPGWYPNPEGPAKERYWDGTQWTEQFRSLDGGSGGARSEWRRWWSWTRRHWVPVVAGLTGLFLGSIVGVSGAGQATTTTETTTVVSHHTQTETQTRTVVKRARPVRVTVTETQTATVAGVAAGDEPDGGGGGSSCDSNYSGCVPPASQGDVDCADLGGAVTVLGSDPHDLDRDGDGQACE